MISISTEGEKEFKKNDHHFTFPRRGGKEGSFSQMMQVWGTFVQNHIRDTQRKIRHRKTFQHFPN